MGRSPPLTCQSQLLYSCLAAAGLRISRPPCATRCDCDRMTHESPFGRSSEWQRKHRRSTISGRLSRQEPHGDCRDAYGSRASAGDSPSPAKAIWPEQSAIDWHAGRLVLRDGRTCIDINATEWSMRPMCLGRKNGCSPDRIPAASGQRQHTR
jgi:hypothetical protein